MPGVAESLDSETCLWDRENRVALTDQTENSEKRVGGQFSERRR